MQAIIAMKKQVGNLKVESGIATRGLMIRHLVLPGKLAGTERIIGWIKQELGAQTALSLMAQYQPLHRANESPDAQANNSSEDEYERLLDLLTRSRIRKCIHSGAGKRIAFCAGLYEGRTLRPEEQGPGSGSQGPVKTKYQLQTLFSILSGPRTLVRRDPGPWTLN